MTAALLFLIACALVGLYSRLEGRKAYLLAFGGACVLTLAYYGVSGFM
jgi:hypothetical protein